MSPLVAVMDVAKSGKDALPCTSLPSSLLNSPFTHRFCWRSIKTYRGAMEITLTVGEKQVGSYRREGHKVHYSGHLDLGRNCITGRGTIRHWGLLGWILPPQAWGTFELYKKS